MKYLVVFVAVMLAVAVAEEAVAALGSCGSSHDVERCLKLCKIMAPPHHWLKCLLSCCQKGHPGADDELLN